MLIDTTLREGEQRYGVYFAPEDKERIVDGLVRLGVEEIELGVAGRDGCVSRLMGFARARIAELAESGRPGGPKGPEDLEGPEVSGHAALPVLPALGVWCPCR